MGDYIDESEETYEDPFESPDKDEVMPQLRQEETSTKPIRQTSRMPKPQVSIQEHPQTKSTREKHDEMVFKNDTLRKKYDLRNVDEKKINNIFLRAHIRQLKQRTDELRP
jgi:hypothetical protein